MSEITLKTGVKITQDKNGNITKLISPYNTEGTYGQQCVEELDNLFKSFHNVR